MTRWLAPILSFTAEEIWRYLPGERPESVFLSTWSELPVDVAPSCDWSAVLEARAAVLRELERLRVAGQIGAPLDAEVDLYADGPIREALAGLGDELRFALITSEARVHDAAARPADALPARADDDSDAGGLWLRVVPASAAKCVRCWHKRADVGTDARHPELCGRCVANLEDGGEIRRYA